MPDERPDVTVTLTLRAETAELLSVLGRTEYGPGDLQGVLMQLVDHARQGVQRPGAWEREWLCSAFGYDWPDLLECDPEVRHHDRVRRSGDG